MKFSITGLTLEELNRAVAGISDVCTDRVFELVTEQELCQPDQVAVVEKAKKLRTRKPKVETPDEEQLHDMLEVITEEVGEGIPDAVVEEPKMTRVEFVNAVITRIMSKKLTVPEMLEVVRSEGIPSLNDVPDDDDLIRKLIGRLL